MSAPRFVNTKDGVCWTRRTVTSGGIALYAPEGVCKCPEFVMATLAELAEHGIVGSADVLPVKVGPVSRTLDVVEDELTGVSLSLYEEELATERLRWALASAKRGRARLRAQVAALLEERRSTNEALDDAVQELRARQSCPCPPADQPGPHQLGCPQAEAPPSERPVNELTTVFPPVSALREVPSGETDPARRAAWRMLSRDEPHDSPLHQDHRIPHDLQVPKSCRLDADQVDEVSRRFIGGGA